MLSKVNYLAKIFFLTMDILMSFIVDHMSIANPLSR